jgi:pimeloyl-ACP methyl ester carboxylesterase
MVRKLSALLLLPLLAGCLSAGYPRESHCTLKPSVSPPAGVVFVANGSGDFHTVTDNLAEVVSQACVPVEIQTFTWSHGYGRYVYDHVHHANQVERGRCLTAQIMAYHQAFPERRIFLMGHSAGCAVVLAAAESLPPDSIDRVILLAPSVSQEYDLRMALRAARYGIDSFNSGHDYWILGLGMRIFGTADGRGRAAAGHSGFVPIVACPADAALYSKLRQHPWDPVVQWSGHSGGHYGSNQVGFLRAYVLPLLVCG